MILLTGATGNVGAEVARLLDAAGIGYRAASRPGFDFERRETFAATLAGVDRVFLVRPPALSDVKRSMRPFLEAVARAGVRQVVFLSIQGADKNRVVPHRKIEDLLGELGVPSTFLRAGFFMQNLSTTHAPELRERGEILVPAGGGRTSFVDARDVAAVGARALVEDGHVGRAYELTGAEALTYGEVAEIMTAVLGRPIVYRRPGVARFARAMRARGLPWRMIGVMIGIYTTARLGLAGRVSGDVERLLGRPPIGLAAFVRDHRAAWEPRPGAAGSGTGLGLGDAT